MRAKYGSPRAIDRLRGAKTSPVLPPVCASRAWNGDHTVVLLRTRSRVGPGEIAIVGQRSATFIHVRFSQVSRGLKLVIKAAECVAADLVRGSVQCSHGERHWGVGHRTVPIL